MNTLARKVAAVSSSIEAATRAGHVPMIARLILMGKGEIGALPAIARQRGIPDHVVTMVRSAVAAGDTAPGNWGALLGDYANASAAFLESLRPISVFDHLLGNGMRRVPLKTNIRVITGNVTGHGVNSSSVKPISSLSVDAEMLEPQKAIAMVIISDELARFATPGSEQLFNNELRKAAAAATDQVFLAGLAADETPTASAGSSAANVYTDLAALLAALDTGATSRLFFIIGAANAKKLMTKTTTSGDLAFPQMGPSGGSILPGVTALVSDQVAASTAMMIDATQLLAETGPIGLSMSRHTTLQFSDAPDFPPTALTGVINLWQFDLRALMAERFFGFAKVRANSVAVLSGVTY